MIFAKYSEDIYYIFNDSKTMYIVLQAYINGDNEVQVHPVRSSDFIDKQEIVAKFPKFINKYIFQLIFEDWERNGSSKESFFNILRTG